MAFLGHIIFSDGVDVDPRKIKAVKIWPRPLTPNKIMSFLGLAGYYRRFVDGFSSIESHFITLTQKSKKSECSAGCE